MNKKIFIPLIVILVAAGLVFLVTVRTSKPNQPLEETLSVLRDEIRLIHEEAWGGKINQEEVNERFTVLEGKVTKLINQHGLQGEINEFVSQRKTAEELTRQVELQVITIRLQLAGIAEIDAELATPLIQKLSGIMNKIDTGQASPEETEEKLTALENKISELVVQYGIETEVDEFMVRMEDIKELTQWAEPQITAIELQLAGIAEYFVEKYRIDTGAEVKQTRALQNKLMDLADDIWEKELVREEINEKLLVLENKADEMIAKHNIQAEVDKYANRSKAGLGRIAAIDQRIKNIQLQLHGLELYLSD